MTIEFQDVTKRFGQSKALNNVSFTVERGEIVGLLGPNGAGKTTTLRLISGFLYPTRGKVLVSGQDTRIHAREIRSQLGYLPENNPMYEDMKVWEFLSFIGQVFLYRPKKLRRAIANVVEISSLGEVVNKNIGTLSKGFRQRVGLASCLVHDPDILILDEPTSGLDPNQVIEIRNLIKELSSTKTILLSTHILPEVSAICQKVLIMNHGEVVADSAVSVLSKSGETKIHLEIKGKHPELSEQFKIMPEVMTVSHKGQGPNTSFVITADKDISAEISEYCLMKKLAILSLFHEEVSLEDVFRRLTHKNVEN